MLVRILCETVRHYPVSLGTTTIPLLDNKVFGIVAKRLFTKEDLIARLSNSLN